MQAQLLTVNQSSTLASENLRVHPHYFMVAYIMRKRGTSERERERATAMRERKETVSCYVDSGRKGVRKNLKDNGKLNLCLSLINLAPHHEDVYGTGGTDPNILNLFIK
jgi:hypothetical protein